MLNVTCPHGALSEAVQVVSRGVSGRSTQPVQNNILMEATRSSAGGAGGDVLRLVATDLEYISIEATVPVEIAGEGSVTAPAKLLAQIVSSLPEAAATLFADEAQALAIACGKSNYTIRGLSAADFQTFPALTDERMGEGLRVSLPQAQLAEVLRQTAFGASRDKTRPILTGALFSFSDGTMQIVATDTYRLARRKVTIAGGFDGSRTAIVSARALNELLRVLLADSDDLVNLAVTDNQIEFEVGNVKLGSRLIEGQFPNYEKVIPASHEKRITVVADDLAQALRRAQVIAREDDYLVSLRTADGALQVSAASQDVGKVTEELACQLEGEPAEISFNCRFLLEMLEATGAQKVQLDLSGPLNPGMIRAEGVDDYLCVLMPMGGS